jgi:hypothetical protein
MDCLDRKKDKGMREVRLPACVSGLGRTVSLSNTESPEGSNGNSRAECDLGILIIFFF